MSKTQIYYQKHREKILARAKARYKPVSYCTCIGIKFEMRKKLDPILKRIAKKDETFQYDIVNSKFPHYDQIIVIFSGTKEQAHKRGLLFCKRYAPTEYNLTYWVKRITAVKKEFYEKSKGRD